MSNESPKQQSSGQGGDTASGRHWILYGAIALAILCVPLALLGAILPVNKYTAFDPSQIGMVDCDGPISVLILTVPAFVIYLGIFFVTRMSPAFRGRLAVIVALIAIAMAVLVVPNTARAVIEMSGRSHREVCG